MAPRADVVIIGGGFYGLFLAAGYGRRGARVVLCEAGDELMARASYGNQARVHNGYHYPRSILTARRSRVNFPRFVDEFRDCVSHDFESVYAIGRHGSKVSARQFQRVMERVGAPIAPASDEVAALFDPRWIEAAFTTVEHVFDAERLRDRIRQRAVDAGVELRLGCAVEAVTACDEGLRVTARQGSEPLELVCRTALSCTYAATNHVLARSGLPEIPLKHELAEMALVAMPDALRGVGVTVMCGPFFSCLPFPPTPGLHTLSHVRYTPHCSWHEGPAGCEAAAPPVSYALRDDERPRTAFPYMVRDARRYLPAIDAARYVRSLWEVKTVLPRSEMDDSRPILLRRDHGLPGLHVVLGGKIDNVYDIARRLEHAPA